MGAASIPITVMWEWCARRGLSPEVAEHTVSVLRHVDAALVDRAIAREKLPSRRES